MTSPQRILATLKPFVPVDKSSDAHHGRDLSGTKGVGDRPKGQPVFRWPEGQKVFVSPYATAFVRFVLLSTRSQKAYLLNPSLSFVLMSRPARNACVHVARAGARPWILCLGRVRQPRELSPHLRNHQLYFSQAIVWDKQHPVLTRKDFLGCFELAFYGWKEGAAHRFYGPNNVPDLWHVKKVPPQQMEHLTQKCVELAERAMQYSTVPGEHVLDLFGGSGSTLIGAERTGRKAFLMELDRPYCDLIVDRYQRFTGKPGVLERTGESPIPMKPRDEAMR